MSRDALHELTAVLGEGAVITDPDITASYRQDRAFDPDAGMPLAVVRPRSTEEVSATLKWASAHHISVV
ncbi:FAD-binding oxidoreductase, partial [Mycobacteroides abscessus]